MITQPLPIQSTPNSPSSAQKSVMITQPLPIQSPLLTARSRYVRHLIVDALAGGDRGHPGSSFSLVEIVQVLYDKYLRFRPQEPLWIDRDRFILSKGHGCLALYALLADKGFFPKEELGRFCRSESFLGGHPERGKVPGIEASTGSLGHGLSIAIGMALALRLQHNPARVVVVMGDGEINEGSVWEAALSAAKHGLDTLSVWIDYNKLQSYGLIAEVLALEPLADKWRAFGFAVSECDGHDPQALEHITTRLPLVRHKPSLIICHTIKGKGIPDAEHNPSWHHKTHFSSDQIQQMRLALEEPGCAKLV